MCIYKQKHNIINYNSKKQMHYPKLWKIIGCQMNKKASHESTEQNQKTCPTFSSNIHTQQFEIQEQKMSPTGFLNPLNISQIQQHENNVSFTSFGNRKFYDKAQEELDVYFGTFEGEKKGEKGQGKGQGQRTHDGSKGQRILWRGKLGGVRVKVNQIKVQLGSFHEYYKEQINKIKNIYEEQLKELHKLYQQQFLLLNKQKTSYFQKVTKLQKAYNQNLQMEKVLKQKEAQCSKQISNNKEIIQILMDKIQVMKVQKQHYMLQNNEISQKLFQAQQKIIQMSVQSQKQQQKPTNMLKPGLTKPQLRLKTQPQYPQPLTALPRQTHGLNFQTKSLKQITISPNCNRNKLSVVEKDKGKYYPSNINININNSTNGNNNSNNHYYSDFGDLRDYQCEVNRKLYGNLVGNVAHHSTFDLTSQCRYADKQRRTSNHDITNLNNYSTIHKKQDLQKLLKQQTSLQKKHELKETTKIWPYKIKSPQKPQIQPYKPHLLSPKLQPHDNNKIMFKNKRNKNSQIVNNSTSSNPYTDKNYDQHQYQYQYQDKERNRERYSFGDKKSEKIALIGQKLNKMRSQIYHELRSMREIQSEN